MFSKVLVANRGEIAVRVMRTLEELGISSVAVYSEPDRDAPHVRRADEAYLLGPGPAAESYLVVEKILEGAEKAGAEAIHPGYGFLSENAAFARACDEAGITFVGPRPEILDQLGDKVAARRIAPPAEPGARGAAGRTAQRAKVRARSGGDKPVSSADEAAALAEKLGYPVIVK